MSGEKKPFISDKLAKRRKADSRAKRILSFVILLAILTGLGLLTYAKRFYIKDVEVSGTEVVSADELKNKTENEISGLNLIIPKRNIFFYPKQNLKKELAQTFPRLDSIEINVENKNLRVAVTEREPAYLWCGEKVPMSKQEAFSNECYFVDDTGFIYALAPQFSESVYPKIYTKIFDDETSQNPTGKNAMVRSLLSNISIFAKQISNSAMKPSAFSINNDGDALIFLFRDSDILPEVRYNPVHDPIVASTGFKTAINSEPLKSKLAQSFSKLEYIDVRFANKVFYKFKSEEEKDNAGDVTTNQ